MARYTEIPRSVLEMLPESLDVDNQIRVIYFLATSIHNGTADPFLSALESVIANQQVFQGVAQRFADDTRLVEIDPDYRQFMQDIWTNYLREDNLPPDRDGQEFDFNAHQLSIMPASQYNFLLAVSRMPAKNYEALIATIKSVGGAGRLAVWAEHSLTSARKLLPVARVALVAVFLAADIIINIRRWWKGEITGVRCVKNILDNGVSVAAGIAGGIGGEIGGAAVGGAIGGPVGAAVGAVVGAVAGSISASYTAHVLSDKLTQWIFGLPQSEALENAYKFLGVKCRASNADINRAYHRLALLYHPDKVGNTQADSWTRLQYSMAVIREARREY